MEPGTTVSSRWDELLEDRSLEDLLKLIPGYDPLATAGECVFDEEAAASMVDFFAIHLRHVKGELSGKPFFLDPWEAAIVGNLFGWKRPDGTRRYREAFIYVPKKQGKTLMAASIANAVLFCDGEPGAEIYTAAAERDQASISFNIAKQQVLMDPKLRSIAGVYRKAITIESMGSTFQPLSAEASTKHGYNPHVVIVDELHAQKSRDLVDALTQGIASRRQPIVIYITTSDFDRPSICNEKLDYALRVRDGIIENVDFLPVIYRAEREEDWKDPRVWSKANPGLGRSVPVDFMESQCRRAQETPSFENTFKRLHLNMKTEQDVRILPMDKWDGCSNGTLDSDSLVHGECFGGLDLASIHDIAAFVLVFPKDGKYDVLPFFWVPQEQVKKRENAKANNVPYAMWSAQGFLETTDGNEIDYDVIRKRIVELGDRYRIRKIGIDPWNATQITTQLDGDGFELEKFPQTFKTMNAPMKELERLVCSGSLHHGRNPVLRWMASNLAAEQDSSENLRPSKKKSADKIDGIVALLMALGVAMATPAKAKSIYETRGLLTI